MLRARPRSLTTFPVKTSTPRAISSPPVVQTAILECREIRLTNRAKLDVNKPASRKGTPRPNE